MKIIQSETFGKWFSKLKDKVSKVIIASRIHRLSEGLFGDVKSVGEAVSELRIHYGPGYRVYFTIREDSLVILLVGGDKSTQTEDIKKAKQLAKDYYDDREVL